MFDKSICRPRSQVDWPEWLWPPHFTATSRLWARAKLHRRLHVRRAGGLRDEGGMLVEGRIQDQARLVVTGVAGEQQRAAHSRREVADIGAAQRDLAAVAGDCRHVGHLAGAHHRVRNADAGKRCDGGQQR